MQTPTKTVTPLTMNRDVQTSPILQGLAYVHMFIGNRHQPGSLPSNTICTYVTYVHIRLTYPGMRGVSGLGKEAEIDLSGLKESALA